MRINDDDTFDYHGNTYLLVDHAQEGATLVRACVCRTKRVKKELWSDGYPVENLGGYAREADFNYDTALVLACQNAADLLDGRKE